jgi:hypothetical protein
VLAFLPYVPEQYPISQKIALRMFLNASPPAEELVVSQWQDNLFSAWGIPGTHEPGSQVFQTHLPG